MRKLLFIVLLMFIATNMSNAVSTTYHDGGTAGSIMITLNYEKRIATNMSFVVGLVAGEMFQIDTVPTLDNAFMASLTLATRYYLKTSEQLYGYFIGVQIDGSIMTLPYKNVPSILGKDYYENYCAGYSIEFGYKFSKLPFSVYNDKFRIFIEPTVGFRQIYFSPRNTYLPPSFTTWFSVGVKLGLELIDVQVPKKRERKKKQVEKQPPVTISTDSITNTILSNETLTNEISTTNIADTNTASTTNK